MGTSYVSGRTRSETRAGQLPSFAAIVYLLSTVENLKS